MFTYIFLYLYIYIFLIIEYISPALKLGRGIYFYNKKNILRLTGTCRASIQIIFILWEAGGWCTSLPNIIFLYAELKERIMPKSYYRRCKNSSYVNGYNEMRIRKRQVHCWPFLTGISDRHIDIVTSKTTRAPTCMAHKGNWPSRRDSGRNYKTVIDRLDRFSSLFLPYNNFLLNFCLIT